MVKPRKLTPVAGAGIILGLGGSILLEGGAELKDVYPLGWIFFISSIAVFCVLIAILSKSENEIFDKLEKIDKIEMHVDKLVDQVSKLADIISRLDQQTKKPK